VLIAIALFAGLVALAPAKGAHAQDLPEPRGYVSDFAGVLPADTKGALEEALRLAEQETTVQIAVVTVKDLGGDDINGYAVRLFEKWGIGKKGSDNGLLLITAIAERKVRIEVGYGLEGYITDSRAGRILDESVLPDFREDHFALGIVKGAEALRRALDETGYTSGAEPSRDGGVTDLGISQPLADKIWLIILLGVFSLYAIGLMSRTRSIWFGSVWGAGVGGLTGWLAWGWPGLAIGGVGLAGGGLMLDAMLSSAYRYNVSKGRSTKWHRTWGGFGGSVGGMRSGGGFGGFGGGRSGGGGAKRGF
jgi:uncharacterized protein